MRLGYVRRYRRSTADAQLEKLEAGGIKRNRIYVEGEAGETLDSAIRALRKGDELAVVRFRCLGNSLRAIRAAYDAVQARGASVLETSTGRKSGDHGPAMYHDAHKELHGEASSKSKREMARRGKKGQEARDANKAATRMPIGQARKIWFNKSLTTKEALNQMWGWTRQSAYRHRSLGKRGLT